MMLTAEETAEKLAQYDWDTANRILTEVLSEMRGADFESTLPDDPDIAAIKESLKAEIESKGEGAVIEGNYDPL